MYEKIPQINDVLVKTTNVGVAARRRNITISKIIRRKYFPRSLYPKLKIKMVYLVDGLTKFRNVNVY